MEKSRPTKVLSIRLSAMGDVAMTIPILNLLVKQYPGLQIIVLTKPLFEPLFTHLKTVSVFKADIKNKHKGLLGLWRLFSELNEFKIDGVADLHNVLRSRILSLFFILKGTKLQRINKGRKGKRDLTSQTNKIFKPLKSTVERYRDVFSQLGYTIDLNDNWVTPKRAISSNLHALMANDGKQLIGIAPFAAFPGKMYPLSLMEEVISSLNKTNKYKIFLFGGGYNEKRTAEKWEQEYLQCKSLVGKYTFAEELAIISNLKAMLAMDSGNGHLSAMFGVPTITLWGITHPYAGFVPFGQDSHNSILADRSSFPLIPTSVYGNKMPEGYEKAMSSINPMTVLSRINDICEINSQV